MEIRKGLGIGLLVVTLYGCVPATYYVPPTAPPPAEWTGESGWEVQPETIKVHEGARRPGDVLVEYELKPRQTAVVLEGVRSRTPYGKYLILPEGTKLFAENFTLPMKPEAGGNKDGEQPINPIEWCAVLPHGPNGKQAGDVTRVCLFWENATQARYIEDYHHSGFGSSDRMTIRGILGPVPKIKVQPVDLGVSVVSRLHLVKVSAQQIELEEKVTDGSNEYRIGLKPVAWGKDGQKQLYRDLAGQFELVAAEGFTSVEFKETASSVAARAPGQPIVRACVDSTGALVGEPTIATSSGKPQLDEAALQLAKKGRYKAGEGKTGPDCFKFRVKFDLKNP